MSPKWEREEKVGVPEGSMHGPWIVGNTEMSGLPYAPQIFDADMTEYLPFVVITIATTSTTFPHFRPCLE